MEMSERGGPLPSENSQTVQVVGKKTPGEREVPGSIYCLFSSWFTLNQAFKGRGQGYWGRRENGALYWDVPRWLVSFNKTDYFKGLGFRSTLGLTSLRSSVLSQKLMSQKASSSSESRRQSLLSKTMASVGTQGGAPSAQVSSSWAWQSQTPCGPPTSDKNSD